MAPRFALDGALPVDDVLPSLRRALATERAAVLQAPPGAGKTTRVPLALLDEPWLAGQRLVMLEPRRLAARAAARWMAAALKEPVGETVGFRVRGETRVGARTRIEVVTEGVLTRFLHADPSLDGIGLVIFDEFHERSVHADLGLALTLQSRELLRPDLRLLVMSATLESQVVSSLLDGAPILRSEGRAFPVEVRYLARRADQRVEGATAAAIRTALAQEVGSVLAFLPGAGEIGRTAALLEAAPLPHDVRVYPLFGDLPAAMQDAAIWPAGDGERKVVLATSIAETSLTIDGIQVVIDGGLIRVPRFSPRSGMTQLATVRVSRASAHQRCGRAGRTAAGVCYRLWAEEDQAGLLERSPPEILEADLAALALDLAEAGVGDGTTLRWIDPPPAPALAQARALLIELEAIEASGRITTHGRSMLGLGVHPRLAHMLLRARDDALGATACVVAALLDERDVLRRDAAGREADLRLRVGMLAEDGQSRHLDVDRDALRRVRERSRVLRSQLGVPRDEQVVDDATGWLLALAYPDRVAQRRAGAGDRFLMRNGRGAVLETPGALAGASFLAIADLDGRVPESRVFLAAPVERQDIERLFSMQFTHEDVVKWDAVSGTIMTRRRQALGAIVLRDAPLRDTDDLAVAEALLHAIGRRDGLALRWSESAQQLRARLVFLRRLDPVWPDCSDAALAGTMESWLLPHLVGLRRREQVEALDPAAMLLEMLTWQQRRELELLAPAQVTVPTGSSIRIDYGDPESPSLAVRLQELFGLADTPRIAAGRVPLTLHLLSPARRPVQVTRDLAGFWRTSYFEVRKDLRGRYPKHEWPDDPLSALPTRRAKRRH